MGDDSDSGMNSRCGHLVCSNLGAGLITQCATVTTLAARRHRDDELKVHEYEYVKIQEALLS